MQAVRTQAQVEASRSNGARSCGPTTAGGKARAALNGTRHGLCSAHFFLLPDEDPAGWAAFAAGMLATLRPSDDAERHAAERAVQAMWREIRADRLEAVILGELFAAGSLTDAEAARSARDAGMKALSTLLRYRARIQRDIDRALHELDCLRERPGAAPAMPRPSEPNAGPGPAEPSPPPHPVEPYAGGTSEPGRPQAANRHERRRLAALERQAERRAA
jgi:hypothetical protein